MGSFYGLTFVTAGNMCVHEIHTLYKQVAVYSRPFQAKLMGAWTPWMQLESQFLKMFGSFVNHHQEM